MQETQHHTSLCSSEAPKPHDSRSSNLGGGSFDIQVVPVTTTASPHTSPLTSHSHNHTHTCLLKTAAVPVNAGSIKTLVNTLFDEGAQRSLISVNLSTELCIQPT